MALIRPSADLRNNYNEISKFCHATKEPVHITKNGVSDLVLLSDEAYEELIRTTKETEEERIDKLISKRLDKHYINFEEFKKDVLNKIEQAFKDIEKGNYTTMEFAVRELEEKYGL